MAFTVAVFSRGKSTWWRRVTELLVSSLPVADILVFRDIEEWLGAARGISGDQLLLMGPQTTAELDVMVAAKEMIREREVILVLPRDMKASDARMEELRPRVVLTVSDHPEEVTEAVRKVHDRSMRRADRCEWQVGG